MNLYEEYNPTAVELLGEFGAPATLIRTSEAFSRLDPITDRTTLVPGTEERQTVQMVVLDLEWQDDEGREVTRATAIMVEEPKRGDRILQGSMAYIVGLIRATAPQGQAIIYEAQVS